MKAILAPYHSAVSVAIGIKPKANFDSVASIFPYAVVEIDDETEAKRGTALYIKGPDSLCALHDYYMESN